MKLLEFRYVFGICSCEEHCLLVLFEIGLCFLILSNLSRMKLLSAFLHSGVGIIEKRRFSDLDLVSRLIYQHNVVVLLSGSQVKTFSLVFGVLRQHEV